MTIPSQAIGDLADAPPSILSAVTVSPAADALAWRTLGVDIYIPGLLEHVFGTRFLMAAVGSAARTSTPSSMKELTFLTREGCVNTPDMVINLDDALKGLGWPNDYQYVDIGKLGKTDVRGRHSRYDRLRSSKII